MFARMASWAVTAVRVSLVFYKARVDLILPSRTHAHAFFCTRADWPEYHRVFFGDDFLKTYTDSTPVKSGSPPPPVLKAKRWKDPTPTP